ncbi:hypothetical protein ACFCYB_35655 [Streptomyces sp. NPDC056309]|uniref:hypothetical protein n=1 Tax=unclassified Streptomyces TaxID=2593676 RepID=UPI0035E0D898
MCDDQQLTRRKMLRTMAAAGLVTTTVHLAARASASAATSSPALSQDWVVHPVTTPSTISVHGHSVTMANGIVRRSFHTAPNFTTTSLKNLGTGQEMLDHTGEPEATIVLDGTTYDVGGTNASGGFVYASHRIEDSTQKPYEWTPYEKDGVTPKPYAEKRPWPAQGKALVVTFRPHPSLAAKLRTVTVTARYEIYDGIATVMKKVSVDNTSATPVMIDHLTVDRLHVRSQLAGRLYRRPHPAPPRPAPHGGPSKPGPGRPPGSKNRRPALRHELGGAGRGPWGRSSPGSA